MPSESNDQFEERGIYTILISIASSAWVKVGSLGEFGFLGLYAYTGSAMGKGSTSLNRRTSRHLSHEKRIKWHVDYLLGHSCAEIKSIVSSITKNKSKECEVSRSILSLAEAPCPVEKFGSSDCSCKSHLAYLGRDPSQALQIIAKAHARAGLSPRIVFNSMPP